MSPQKFTPEFKHEVANLVIEQNYTISQASTVMGVSKSALRHWVKQLLSEKKGNTPLTSKAITAEQQRIEELKARLRQVEREKEILKKASALLMLDSYNRLV